MLATVSKKIINAGQKYQSALTKTLGRWKGYCGCSEPGLEVKCVSCPYFIEFVGQFQDNLPKSEEYSPIPIPECNDYTDEVMELCLDMFRNGYSIHRISYLLGIGNYKIIRGWIKGANLLPNISDCNEAKKALVLKLYQEGKNPVEVEAETGVDSDSIRNYICKKGVARAKKYYSEEQKNKALEMFQQGCSYDKIEKATTIPPKMVMKYVAKANLPRRKRVGRVSPYSREIKLKCVALRKEGKSYTQIQQLTGISTTTIKNWVDKYS